MSSTPHFDLWSTIAAPHLLAPEQLALFEKYLDLLIKANETMNLTRVVDREQARLLHIADALTLLPHIPPGTKVLTDIGSGGGVPGLVLAIALPETRVNLVESTGKKAAFLRAAATEMGLQNVSVHPSRAEDMGRCPMRDNCDVVTARAVGAMVWVAEWGLPLVRKGGKLLAMKGPKLAEELPEAMWAIRAMNAGEPIVHPVTSLPGQTGHVICEVPKIGKTDPKYPRDPSIAKGKSL